MPGNVRAIGVVQRNAERLQNRCPVCRREFDAFRRHLALFDAIVDENPAVANGAIGEVERERGKVKPTFGGFTGVASGAGFPDRRTERLRREPTAGGSKKYERFHEGLRLYHNAPVV
jgi:hypothetical protein